MESKFWARFCRRLGHDEYIKLQWESDLQAKLQTEIRGIILTKTRDEWVDFFAGDDICFTPVLTMKEMCCHPQVMARDMIMKLHDFRGSGRDIPLTGVPIKMSGMPVAVEPIFPELGQNNEEILKAAGYCGTEIEDFRREGVI